MKSKIFYLLVISLLLNACRKDTPTNVWQRDFVMKQLIGKWSPYQVIDIATGEKSQNQIGDFCANNLFGVYTDSFEIVSDNGEFIPATNCSGEFKYSEGKRGEISYNELDKTFEFIEFSGINNTKGFSVIWKIKSLDNQKLELELEKRNEIYSLKKI